MLQVLHGAERLCGLDEEDALFGVAGVVHQDVHDHIHHGALIRMQGGANLVPQDRSREGGLPVAGHDDLDVMEDTQELAAANGPLQGGQADQGAEVLPHDALTPRAGWDDAEGQWSRHTPPSWVTVIPAPIMA